MGLHYAAGHSGQFCRGFSEQTGQLTGIHANPLQNCANSALFLRQKSLEQVYGRNFGMFRVGSQSNRFGQGFLGFDGKFVESHGFFLPLSGIVDLHKGRVVPRLCDWK
jgi:hypothetical protein